MTKGGYGIIYKANWLKSYQHFFNDPINSKVIKIYGFTKDGLEDYILVLEYASGGDLHKYLQKNFTTITWNNKLNILSEISTGLEYIHKDEFIHRDFHSDAIYTSRPLSALISECSSTNSSIISFGNKQGYNYNYISEEQELDIKIESSSSQNLTIQNSLISLNKRNIEESNLETHDNNGKRIKYSL
ncbi:unnamed protein product [Rhizophagus irregularis]|nr:unnamed protein product [Rhizophagus irregularis]